MTNNGHIPRMLATMSTRWGIPKSFVKMVSLRAGWEDIQSRVSALFNRLTMNSVMTSPSKLTNTLGAVRCKQRLNKRRSKLGLSISFWRYPLPSYSQRASTRMVDPPLIETTDTSVPSASLLRINAENFYEDCCSSDPTLPQNFSGRCLSRRCEEAPALRRLVPLTPRYSSRVTVPNWCRETNSEDTSRSVWWTKAGNKLDAHRLREYTGQ